MKKTIKRRRKENKTDYLNRIKLLKSDSPRLVLRKTNKYFIAQYVTSEEAQDKIEFGVTSKNLIKYGWPKEALGSLKSIPAAYLTGYLFGKKIINQKKKVPIVDFGMMRCLHKTKPFGFLKGLNDSGIKINSEKEIFPDESKINREGDKIPFEKIKLNIEKNA